LWLNRDQASANDVPQGTSKHINDTQATLARTCQNHPQSRSSLSVVEDP